MKVPFIDLKRHEPTFIERWLAKVDAMTRDAQFIGGSEVAALESRLAKRLGVEHAISCANGTDALQLALRALGIGQGDLVLVPNATFWASFEAVVNVGAAPATVDISLRDGALDIESLRAAFARTSPKAVMLVHLYGWGSAAIDDIRALCRDHSVALVEDGAQSFGTLYHDVSIFKHAQVATTSFYPAKVLGAAGDAGAVFTNDAQLADRVRQIGNHGRSTHYGHAAVGWNSRMDALQAAFLNLSLDHIDARLASRRSSAQAYRELLPAAGLDPMPAPPGYQDNGYCNVCLLSDADAKTRLQSWLQTNGVGFANIYPGTMSEQDGAHPYLRGHFGGDQARQLCQSALSLPLFPYMTQDELAHVISVVRAWSR